MLASLLMNSEISPAILWATFGLLLLIIELFTQSFVCVFFGIAALVVGGLSAILPLENIAIQVTLFGLIGASGLYFLRDKVRRALRSGPGHSIDRAAIFQASADIPAGGSAKVQYQGTVWDAQNESTVPIRKGDSAIVVATKGIQLVVRPNQSP